MALIIWSIGSAFIVASLTFVAIQAGVVVAFTGYLIGIPWSMWFRLRRGRWPGS